MKRRVQLIPDWRISLRFRSVQVSLVLFALSAIQSDVLPFIQPLIDPNTWPRITAGLALVIVFFRVIRQSKLDELRAESAGNEKGERDAATL